MADLNALYASEYDSATSYAAGDRCVYEKEWYECKTATTGAFDADKWEKKYLVDYLNSNLAIIVRGSKSISSSTTTKISLGFKPKFIYAYYEYTSGDTIYKNITMYDENTPNICKRVNITAKEYFDISLPSTGNNCINSIDSDGFTFGKASGSGTITYIAVK